MKIKKKCVAMLLAGGQGSRLYALTQKVAKPAIPYGGKNRFIDFPLSNMSNAGIRTVGLIMPSNYRSLKCTAVFMSCRRIRPPQGHLGMRALQTPFIRTWHLLNAMIRNM